MTQQHTFVRGGQVTPGMTIEPSPGVVWSVPDKHRGASPLTPFVVKTNTPDGAWCRLHSTDGRFAFVYSTAPVRELPPGSSLLCADYRAIAARLERYMADHADGLEGPLAPLFKADPDQFDDDGIAALIAEAKRQVDDAGHDLARELAALPLIDRAGLLSPVWCANCGHPAVLHDHGDEGAAGDEQGPCGLDGCVCEACEATALFYTSPAR